MLPFVAALAALTCATSPGVTAHTLSPLFGYGSALGAGLVYPVVSLRRGALPVGVGGRYGQKVLWIAVPSKRAVTVTLSPNAWFVHVRVDGSWRSAGRTIRIAGGPAWRGVPSSVAMRAPGCLRATFSTGGAVEIRTATGF